MKIQITQLSPSQNLNQVKKLVLKNLTKRPITMQRLHAKVTKLFDSAEMVNELYSMKTNERIQSVEELKSGMKLFFVKVSN